MSLSKKTTLTIKDYSITLSSPLKFYKNDTLDLVFNINEYGIEIKNGISTFSLMPINALNAKLLIECDGGKDFIEATAIVDNTITFRLDSKYSQYQGVGKMQIVLLDNDGCKITLPEFDYEIKESINANWDSNIQVVMKIISTENGKALTDERGNLMELIKLSELPEASSLTDTDYVMITQNGESKKVKTNLFKGTVEIVNDLTTGGIDKALSAEQGKVIKLQLDNKANIKDVNSKIWTMANMGQDVKEAMTGGSVAVVGKNAILTENIVDNQVTRNKTNFYTISENGNLIDRNAITNGKYIDNNGSWKSGSNETDFIPIYVSKSYTFNFTTFVTYWDENKEFISGYIQGAVSTSNPINLKNIPDNAKFVRLSVFDESLDCCVFSDAEYFSNDLTTMFIDNDLKIVNQNLEGFKVNNGLLENNSISREKINYYSISDEGNLINKDRLTYNKYINNNGQWVSSKTHVETDFIEIEQNQKYKHNIYSFITYWDENKEFISGYIEGNGGVNTPQEIKQRPDNARYVRFSADINAKDTIVVSKVELFSNDLTTMFIDNDLKIVSQNLESNLLSKINSGGSSIANKIVNFLGDSITYGVDGNTNGGTAEYPYPKIISELFGIIAKNYGVPGSTIGGNNNGIGYSCMNIRYANMDDNADYVIVFGGVNDYTANVKLPLGSYEDETNETFYGGLKILINGLIEKYPRSRIGFITPLRKRGDTTPNTYGNTLEQYVNAIKQLCEENSIPYLDLYKKGGCYVENANWRSINMNDGLHPSQEFYYKLAQQIGEFIKSI